MAEQTFNQVKVLNRDDIEQARIAFQAIAEDGGDSRCTLEVAMTGLDLLATIDATEEVIKEARYMCEMSTQGDEKDENWTHTDRAFESYLEPLRKLIAAYDKPENPTETEDVFTAMGLPKVEFPTNSLTIDANESNRFRP